MPNERYMIKNYIFLLSWAIWRCYLYTKKVSVYKMTNIKKHVKMLKSTLSETRAKYGFSNMPSIRLV